MNSTDPNVQDRFLTTLLSEFMDESTSYLAQLHENHVALVQVPLTATADGSLVEEAERRLNQMFRAAHSLKGLSAMLGLESMNCLTHRLESLLDAAVRHELRLSHPVLDILGLGVNRLRAMIEALRDDRHVDAECADHTLLDQIEQLLVEAASRADSSRDATQAANAHPRGVSPSSESPVSSATVGQTTPKEFDQRLQRLATCTDDLLVEQTKLRGVGKRLRLTLAAARNKTEVLDGAHVVVDELVEVMSRLQEISRAVQDTLAVESAAHESPSTQAPLCDNDCTTDFVQPLGNASIHM